MGSLASSAEAFLIRPNLWKPYEDAKPIILDNLPDSSEINIYSVTGQKVKSISNNDSSAIEWNGTNDSGERLGSGVYLAVLKAPSGKRMRKFTIVR